MDELIFRDALLEKMGERVRKYENVDECTELTILEDMHIIKNAPAVDAVLRSVVEQIKWERDCAMQQLKDHGIPFGGIAPAADAREKMIELLGDYFDIGESTPEDIADKLLSNGVTFAKDTDVPSKWISVEDGMPEPMVWVLCACRGNIIEVLRYDRKIDGWGTAGPNRGYMKSFVTHWMPLPEPPRED